VYPGSRRRLDLDNMVVIAKYVQDALVELGVLEDDSYTNIPKISFSFGSLDPKKQGYCNIRIKEIS
jgi:Holliday junction resolvase RusA-like endonuclease